MAISSWGVVVHLGLDIGSKLKSRHWRIIREHLTPLRILNAARCFYNYKRGITVDSFYPFYLKIETTDCCNLKCPGCHDGTVDRKHEFMDISLYKRLLDVLHPYLLEVSLYDQGEPLIDRAIVDYVKYAQGYNIGTVIATNLSFRFEEDRLIQLCTSGLDYLIVAVDGVTQGTYEKYRVGGDLELVISNLKRIIEIKSRLNLKKPFIEWQMIDFPFNRDEQDAAEKMAHECGVDEFILKPDCVATFPPKDYVRKKRCPLLWFSLAVECDGLLSVCLTKDDQSLYMGDLSQNSFAELWSSDEYSAIRGLHNIDVPANKYFCKGCNRHDA